jgi:C-terminal processing protease CtpA/Prc
VDKNTESAAEVLAANLQARGRARIVGSTSMGNTEDTYYYNLDDGSRLWIAEAAYSLPDGTNLEGKGVVPDSNVDVDWTSYPEAADPQILKAVDGIYQTGKR